MDETEVPEGIQAVLEECKLLQDITISHFKEGRSGNEVLRLSREEAIEKGLTPSIYTHPIGYHGHGAGPRLVCGTCRVAYPVKVIFRCILTLRIP